MGLGTGLGLEENQNEPLPPFCPPFYSLSSTPPFLRPLRSLETFGYPRNDGASIKQFFLANN